MIETIWTLSVLSTGAVIGFFLATVMAAGREDDQ